MRTMIPLKSLFAAAVAILFGADISLAGTLRCGLEPTSPFNAAQAKPLFERDFCSKPGRTCDTRWSNASYLMQRLEADKRIPNKATAAYMMATTYLETGVDNFSPATIEHLKNPKAVKYYPYIGRGWSQLTFEDKYKNASVKLGLDLVKHPELALVVDNSYEILVRGMLEGWPEVYRATPGAGSVTKTPVKLGDFITADSIDYGHARAVINANCKMAKPCLDKPYGDKGYLPDPANLDSALLGETKALQFERILCAGEK